MTVRPSRRGGDLDLVAGDWFIPPPRAHQRLSRVRWVLGGAICMLVLAAGAYTLMNTGGKSRLAVPAPAPPIVKVAPPARTYRVTPESEIITELKEEEPAAAEATSGTRLKPAWAATAEKPSANPRRAARAAPAPASAPAAPSAAVLRAGPAHPPASALPAPRTEPAGPCHGQTGIKQAVCLAHRCADASMRNHRSCAAVRETEQKIRERMEQGG